MTQQINLFNPMFLRQEKYFSARTMLQALGLVVVGLGAFYAYAQYQTRALQDLVAQQAHDVAQQRARVAAAAGAGPRSRLHALQAEGARLEAEVKARQALFAKLDSRNLKNDSGFARYLSAFSHAALPGVWLTGFTVGAAGDDLTVHGRALAPAVLPAYLHALSAEQVMHGRKVTALRLSAARRAPPTAGAHAAPAGPERFVEFSFDAPLRVPALPAGGAAKGTAH